MKNELAAFVGLDHEMLSKQEERALLVQLARARGAATAGKRGASARVKRLKDRLVTHNLRLVLKVAKRYRRSGFPLEDLIDWGVCGLLIALDRFDPGRHVNLSTYVVWWIRHQIQRAVADLARPIRRPVHLLEDSARLFRLRDRIEMREGRTATVEELAAAIGVSPQMARVAFMNLTPLSLDAPVFEQDAATLHDAVAADVESPLDALLSKERAEEARRLLSTLPAAHAEVLAGRFAEEPATLQEIGATLARLDGGVGVSRERVRQLQCAGIRTLRGKARDRDVRLG